MKRLFRLYGVSGAICAAAIVCLLFNKTGCGSNPGQEEEEEISSDAEVEQPSRNEMDVTDCVDIYNGEIWSEPFFGQTFRSGGSDFGAAYGRLVLPVLDHSEGAYFEFRGVFPESRFFSFQSSGEGEFFMDKKTDYEILPDDDSVNPFAMGGPWPEGAGLNYSLKLLDVPIDMRDGTWGQNVLFGGFYLKGEGEEQSLYNAIIYRVYLPEDRTISFPRVYYVYEGETKTREEVCALLSSEFMGYEQYLAINENAETAAPRLAENTNQEVAGYEPLYPVEWFIGINIEGTARMAFPRVPDDMTNEPIGANMDAMYVAAFFDPSNEMTIARFKAPEVPAQARYYSVCIMQPLNFLYTWDCKNDEELDLDDDGYVTIVFSSERDKPEYVCKPGECVYNWMPYSSAAPLVWIRQLVPDEETYPNAPHFYEGDPYDSKELSIHMGAHYPKTWYCTRRDFETLGFDCLR